MVRRKILVTRRFDKRTLDALQKRFIVDINRGYAPMSKDEIAKRARGVHGIICFPYDAIDKDVIDAAKDTLGAICTYSVGFEHIDVEYAKSLGIRVGYTPDVLTDATADLTMALILDLLRNVTRGDKMIRKGMWSHSLEPFEFLGSDVGKNTLGILGLGRIGRAVAIRAKAFGMRVAYHNTKRVDTRIEKELGVRYVSMNKLFTDSDVLTLHAPHTRQTDRIITMDVVRKMKPTAFLVNTARGGLVDEADLTRGLRQKLIAGAALDTFEVEPISASHPLLGMDNVILVPHVGSAAVMARTKMADITIKNMTMALDGKKPVYSVT